MLDSITPGTVSVWSTGGSMDCAHWGEIMSTAVKQRGCTGAVIDGGVRDVDFVNAMNYPVFAKFKCSASSVGRWDIVDCQVSIKIGNTVVHPGDFVFGDTDGVVVIPKDMTMDVLVAAEESSSAKAVCARNCGGACPSPKPTRSTARSSVVKSTSIPCYLRAERPSHESVTGGPCGPNGCANGMERITPAPAQWAISTGLSSRSCCCS